MLSAPPHCRAESPKTCPPIASACRGLARTCGKCILIFWAWGLRPSPTADLHHFRLGEARAFVQKSMPLLRKDKLWVVLLQSDLSDTFGSCCNSTGVFVVCNCRLIPVQSDTDATDLPSLAADSFGQLAFPNSHPSLRSK